MANNKSIKKLRNKLATRAWFSIYYGNYLKKKLKDNMVFLESRNGTDMAGNMLYLAKELSQNPAYAHLKLYIASKPHCAEQVKAILKKYGIRYEKLLRSESLHYYKYLSRAKYLMNDTSFPRRFIKKDGQIILNTWHGTPLKNMGRDVENEVYNMGNVQRNLIFSDYLVYPNDYMKEKMIRAYMLENLSHATILNEGYPRNSVFFNTARREELRRELALDGKQVLVYMPTWRGRVNKYDTEAVTRETAAFLEDMDGKLADHQVLFVKYHPLMKLTFSDSTYRHIKAFPNGYEYYDVLNTADVLITDYSSVFYDFATSGRKIILYVYDKEAYFEKRGVYVSLDTFPFPQVTDTDGLVREINLPKNYDDTEFRKLYCTHESPDAAEKICARVFLNKPVTKEEKLTPNGKKNVLIYAGDLNKNGITTALLSVLDNIDLTRYNYYISFRERNLRTDPLRTCVLPAEVSVIPISADMFYDFQSARAFNEFTKNGGEKPLSVLKEAYRREIRRHFHGIKFDHVIHYNGYENFIIGLLMMFDARKTIYVHNDMVQEIKMKHNQNRHFLHWAYNEYDNVIAVSDDIVEPTAQISGKRDNIRVISNFHNHKLVVEKSQMTMEFQVNTEIYCPHPDGVNHILKQDGYKFITIGRFSPEKGHFRLIDAFEEFHKTHSDSSLIIIGGLGKLYANTVKKVRQTSCWENIVLIRSMQNPMPILKQCDLFILSSIYEGLGLVMLEADSLNVPVFSTDVNGPRNFLKHYGGYLVEDSMEGILQGMYDFIDGKIKPMNIDYEKRNEKIREQLESIL